MRRTISSATLTAGLVAALIVFAPSALLPGQQEIDREVELGKKAAAEAEAELKFLRDEALQSRVDRIGQKIASVARVTRVKALYGNDELADFDYTFKIVDDVDVNAFSLPGGFIYINKGLIDQVESDHELAGVIAHEVAHAAHHHVLALMKKQSRLNLNALIVAAVAALSGARGEEIPAT